MLLEFLSPRNVAISVVLVWVVRFLFSRFFIKSPLDSIPGPKRNSILVGNLKQLFDRQGWTLQDELGEQYSSVVKMTGMFGASIKYLYVFDPKALQSIFLKDQSTYQHARWHSESTKVIFGPSLTSTYGETHRRQRKMLNPVFSINHMRHMTPIFYSVANRLRDALALQVKDSPKDVDVLNWMGRTALELIGQGGLGYSFDPLVEERRNEFGDAMKSYFPTLLKLQLFRMWLDYVRYMGSPSFRRWLVNIMPFPLIHKMRDIVDAMHQNAVQIINAKKVALKAGDAAVADEVAQGKDLMSVLLKANSDAREDKLSEEELVAQVASLVFAATDTTSSALAQTMQLLAEHQDVQDRLRKELHAVKHDNEDIPYDTLVDRLPYLDAICRETLRLHPPVSFVLREAFEDAVLPLSKPLRGENGQMISEIPVPKGTGLVVGIRASNRNKDLWGEDALEWKPERWLSSLPENIIHAKIPGVYSNLMTFIGGGRSCIGFKFSQLEMKVVLATLIHSFKFSNADCSNEIVWNVATVRYPTVGKVDNHPSMPLKVEAIHV
ncbi:cytochrome P450 [Abortiporus biennis]|nr:cytochrome P450 [Abortiporus biennis]